MILMLQNVYVDIFFLILTLDTQQGRARELRGSLFKRFEEGQYISMLLNEREVRVGIDRVIFLHYFFFWTKPNCYENNCDQIYNEVKPPR